MKNETPKKTGRQLLEEGLQELPQQLSYNDKVALAAKCEIAYSTLVEYLKGKVSKEKTAREIVREGRKLIIKKNSVAA